MGIWDQGRRAAADGDWSLGNPGRCSHLLHAAPGHSGQGVGHQAGAQAPEQPYLSINLNDVLGCRRQRAWRQAQPRTPTARPHTQTSGFPTTADRSQDVCPGPDTSQLRPQVSPDVSFGKTRSTVFSDR